LKITLAALADYASISIEKKLHVLGIFDTIYAQSVPAAHGKAVLVIRTLAEHEDSDRAHPLEIRLEDMDGQPLFKGAGASRVGTIPPGETSSANLILELNNLPLPKFGRYSCVITLDGEERLRIPLTVSQVPQAPAP
jgi:hypothetical protein